MQQQYPKRLIEVDLPIKRISAHSRRDKSLNHGHIRTLHVWWARRPLAACRAVICASLWPDPADDMCPQSFRDAAATTMLGFCKAAAASQDISAICSSESWAKYCMYAQPENSLDLANPDHLKALRYLLLDFVADVAAWEASTDRCFLDTARKLTQAAHEALGGTPGTRPLVVDPFAGGGAIPFESSRIGASAFASDLNPLAVLLNRSLLELIPNSGSDMPTRLLTLAKEIQTAVAQKVGRLYPSTCNSLLSFSPQPETVIERGRAAWYLRSLESEIPIAYFWARTIKCEGPGCGADIPLLRSLWLARTAKRSVAFRIIPRPRAKRVDVKIVDGTNLKDVGAGTVARGSATCPICGYTTGSKAVRKQLRERRGGTRDARLLAVASVLHTRRRSGQGRATRVFEEQGRFYRLPNESDVLATEAARQEIQRLTASESSEELLCEPTPEGTGKGAGRAFSQRLYGIETFGDLYTARQLLSLVSIAKEIRQRGESGLDQTIQIMLACALGRVNDYSMSLCRWRTTMEAVAAANGGQNKMPVLLDFVETNPFGGRGGDWLGQVEWITRVIEHIHASGIPSGSATRASAQCPVLPANSADVVFTDPPYYDAFPYSDLADFFYVWMRRSLSDGCLDSPGPLSPKDEEIVVYDVVHGQDGRLKDGKFFREQMEQALCACREVARPHSIGIVVFANKTTAGWEALVEALIAAGWIVTGSWPIDTERPSRQRALDSAALGSSVHIVCRPRKDPDNSVHTNEAGDWREVLAELPPRIHDWMPRLAREGVVGADAIFACLGPALEIFSRYTRVEKASGEAVLLREYLEQVWAAVSQEALRMVFDLSADRQGVADASGFEEDARLTAMWLWTLHPGNGNGKATDGAGEEEEADEEESGTSNLPTGRQEKKAAVGYALEYDAARKIAQGLGAHLEKLTDVVEIQGETARLLSVSERTQHLFGKDQADAPTGGRKKKDKQMKLGFMAELEAADLPAGQAGAESGMGLPAGRQGEKSVSKAGDTVLDRVHQSMILFAAGRSEAMRRFLVEEGVGRDGRFWTLAQALSALYPAGSDERRWVDGVLARKKGLGF